MTVKIGVPVSARALRRSQRYLEAQKQAGRFTTPAGVKASFDEAGSIHRKPRVNPVLLGRGDPSKRDPEQQAISLRAEILDQLKRIASLMNRGEVNQAWDRLNTVDVLRARWKAVVIELADKALEPTKPMPEPKERKPKTRTVAKVKRYKRFSEK